MSVEAIRKKGKNTHYSNCKFCGSSHDKGECPAFGKRYNSHGGRNHFESKCTQTQKRSDRTRCTHKYNVHEVGQEESCDDNSMEDLTEQIQSLFYS